MINADKVRSLIEALYDLILIRREDYDSLLKYLEAFEYRFKVLEAIKFAIVTKKLCNGCIGELKN